MTTLHAKGRKLARLRRSLGYSQVQLAMRAGVSERTVRNAERGHPIKRDFLEYIAGGLDVSLREVLEEEFTCDSKLITKAESIKGELQSAFTALQADAELHSSSATLRIFTTRYSPGADLLDELLIRVRRQGLNIRELLRTDPHCVCRMSFDAPLFNRSMISVRGCLYASSPTMDKSLRWVLVCAVAGNDIEGVEAFCDEFESEET